MSLAVVNCCILYISQQRDDGPAVDYPRRSSSRRTALRWCLIQCNGGSGACLNTRVKKHSRDTALSIRVRYPAVAFCGTKAEKGE